MSRTLHLDLLSRISVASPCTLEWAGMTGDDRARFCAECKLHVYNLSELTAQEAAALIQRTEGRVCVRLFRRHDGTVLTRDCPVGLHAARIRIARTAGRVAAAIALMFGSVLALGSGRAPTRLRYLQPFSKLCEWLSPISPAQQWQTGQIEMGVMVSVPETTSPGRSDLAPR